jgi:hypothetical protein
VSNAPNRIANGFSIRSSEPWPRSAGSGHAFGPGVAGPRKRRPIPVAPVKVEQSEVLFENEFLKVERNLLSNVATRERQPAVRIAPIDDARHRVVVVPLLADGRMVLVGRYHPAIGRWSLEFPIFWGRSSDAGWAAVVAEGLLRDAGLRATSMKLLGAIEADPSLLAISTIIVQAEGCRLPVIPQADPAGFVAGPVTLTSGEIDSLMASGSIFCGTTLAALCFQRAKWA